MSMNLRLMVVALLIETVPLGIDNRLMHYQEGSHPLGTHSVKVECITVDVVDLEDHEAIIRGGVRVLTNPNNPFLKKNERIVRSDFKLLATEDVELLAYRMGMSYENDMNKPMRLIQDALPVTEPVPSRTRWELLEMDDHHEEEEQPEPTLPL